MRAILFVVGFLGLFHMFPVVWSKLVACDNFITRNIPGGMDIVNTKAAEHRLWLQNTSTTNTKWKSIQWKHEFWKNLDIKRLPKCTDFHKFGEQYDEIKYFCAPKEKRNNCNVFSLGSNNKWEFEEQMYRHTGCNILTFDCTLNVTIPPAIRDRTMFYDKCIGNPKRAILGRNLYKMTDLKKLTGVNDIDYLKIDIEGYEWEVLRDMIDSVVMDPMAEKGLPLQLFVEFHLDRSPDGLLYYGKRLKKIFSDLFGIGYMLMFARTTVQSRNTDGLLVKVLCNEDII